MNDNRQYVLNATRANGCDCILKVAPSGEIIAAIKAVAAGGSYLSSAVATALLGNGDTSALLTDREREVLILLAQGKTTRTSR